jgi:methylenetetrahydrofolate--tRNA-(uracil-5-)-methyltransferase
LRGDDRRGQSSDVRRSFAVRISVVLELVAEIAGLPPDEWDNVIIATGPLTSSALAEAIGRLTGEGALAFFDAIAPIVQRHSINMDVAWMQSRYDKVGPGGNAEAYVNCPMSRDQYEAFIDALLAAEKTEFREFEGTPYFDGCLPIEVMAERGRETLRHGPMKPVGLTNAHDPKIKPYAVVQLRQDNALGIVQHCRLPDQAQIRRAMPHHRMIPGWKGADSPGSAACTGTPISIPRLLDARLRLKAAPACASPARSPAARAMSKAPRSASSPAARLTEQLGGSLSPRRDNRHRAF